MGLSQQGYWSGLPFPPPGHLSDPGIKPAFPVLASGFFTTESPEKPLLELVYSVVVVSAVVQSESVIYTYTYPLFCRLFSLIGHYMNDLVF